MHFVDGTSHFGRTLQEVICHPDSPHMLLARRAGVTIPKLAGNVVPSPPIMARVNHNRWIADCPDCNGAEFVFLDELHFWCANCQNASVGHKWRRVKLPENRADIEAILLARPLPDNRNWSVDDDLNAMRQENLDHGLPAEVR